jgi:hypothetical protein
VAEILKICATDAPIKLRDLIFSKRSTNPFPSVFAIILIALHEKIVAQGKKIADYAGAKRALEGLNDRIQTRGATAAEERRKNIDTVKGLIEAYFEAGPASEIYGDHSMVDIEALIRRSEIELANYELK